MPRAADIFTTRGDCASSLSPCRGSKLSVPASKQVTPHQVRARVRARVRADSRASSVERRWSSVNGRRWRLMVASDPSTRRTWAGLASVPRRRRAAHPAASLVVPERHPACDGRKPTLQPSLLPCSILIRRRRYNAASPLALIPRLLHSSCTCTCRSSAPLVSVQSCLILRHHPHLKCYLVYTLPPRPTLLWSLQYTHSTPTHLFAYKHNRHRKFPPPSVPNYGNPDPPSAVISSLQQYPFGRSTQPVQLYKTRGREAPGRERLLQCNPSLHEDQDIQDRPKSQFRC